MLNAITGGGSEMLFMVSQIQTLSTAYSILCLTMKMGVGMAEDSECKLID